MAADLSREKLLLIEWVVKQESAHPIKALSRMVHDIDKETSDSNRLAGYRSRGLRVSTGQLVESIRHSLEEIANGDSVSLDRLEQDSDQW
jgi:hypothetical protein